MPKKKQTKFAGGIEYAESSLISIGFIQQYQSRITFTKWTTNKLIKVFEFIKSHDTDVRVFTLEFLFNDSEIRMLLSLSYDTNNLEEGMPLEFHHLPRFCKTLVGILKKFKGGLVEGDLTFRHKDEELLTEVIKYSQKGIKKNDK